MPVGLGEKRPARKRELRGGMSRRQEPPPTTRRQRISPGHARWNSCEPISSRRIAKHDPDVDIWRAALLMVKRYGAARHDVCAAIRSLHGHSVTNRYRGSFGSGLERCGRVESAQGNDAVTSTQRSYPAGADRRRPSFQGSHCRPATKDHPQVQHWGAPSARARTWQPE